MTARERLKRIHTTALLLNRALSDDLDIDNGDMLLRQALEEAAGQMAADAYWILHRLPDHTLRLDAWTDDEREALKEAAQGQPRRARP